MLCIYSQRWWHYGEVPSCLCHLHLLYFPPYSFALFRICTHIWTSCGLVVPVVPGPPAGSSGSSSSPVTASGVHSSATSSHATWLLMSGFLRTKQSNRGRHTLTHTHTHHCMLILALHHLCSSYLNRPPQCWHWSPTQPGKHTQLPVAVLHCPFIHGLSHSFASVKPGSPDSSPATDSSSAVVSISRLRPRPEPEQARRVAPYILSQKMAAFNRRSAASEIREPTSCTRAAVVPLIGLRSASSRSCYGLVSWLKLVFAGYLVYIFPVVLFPSAAPSRILTSRSDVMGTEMRNRGGKERGFKLLF